MRAGRRNFACTGVVHDDVADLVVQSNEAMCWEYDPSAMPVPQPTATPSIMPSPLPTDYTCVSIGSDSSMVEWGKVGTSGVTGSVSVPEGRYRSYDALALAMSALGLVDSEGVSHDLNVTYNEDENRLEMAVGGASGGWWISNSNSAGFVEVIGHDSSTQVREGGGMGSWGGQMRQHPLCGARSLFPPLPPPLPPSPSDQPQRAVHDEPQHVHAAVTRADAQPVGQLDPYALFVRVYGDRLVLELHILGEGGHDGCDGVGQRA